MKRLLFGTLLVVLISAGVHAQTQTTNTRCRMVGRELWCDAETQSLQLPAPSCAGLLCGALTARTGYLQGQRERAVPTQEELDRGSAEIAQLEDILRGLRAAADREQAQRALFNAKAKSVWRGKVDTAGFPLRAGSRMTVALQQEARERLGLLWQANRDASSAEITDALNPIFADYRRRSEAFVSRLTIAVDGAATTFHIPKGTRAYKALWTAMSDHAGLIATDDFDASVDDIARGLEPVVDSIASARTSRNGKRP